jgi:formylglycine-generating enzyme required for sulfatase activity
MKKQAIIHLLILKGFSYIFDQSYETMITVESRTFIMSTAEIDFTSEQPSQQVTLNCFKIGKIETTLDQWKVFCNAISRSIPKTPSW